MQLIIVWYHYQLYRIYFNAIWYNMIYYHKYQLYGIIFIPNFTIPHKYYRWWSNLSFLRFLPIWSSVLTPIYIAGLVGISNPTLFCFPPYRRLCVYIEYWHMNAIFSTFMSLRHSSVEVYQHSSYSSLFDYNLLLINVVFVTYIIIYTMYGQYHVVSFIRNFTP